MSRQEREPKRHIAYAQELREQFSRGLLSELTPYPHFVVWKYTLEHGRLKKRPFNPQTHMPARINDPRTWTGRDTALTALESGDYNGIGFVFSESDPFTGTDLDACVSKDGSIAPWAKEIITSLSTYTEYSPSHLGIHLLTQASLSGSGHKIGNVEMYSQGRFFTITTDHVPGTPTTIEQRQEQQTRLYTSLVPQTLPTGRSENTRGGAVSFGETLAARPDEEVLEKAIHARNGEGFTQLWRGDITGFVSKSEADFTLVLRLLYWTNDDVEQTKRLFRQSGLYDPEKTDRLTGEHTYLDVTIYNALRKRDRPGR